MQILFYFFIYAASKKKPTKNNEIIKNNNNKQRENEVINPKQKNSWKTLERYSSNNTKKIIKNKQMTDKNIKKK